MSIKRGLNISPYGATWVEIKTGDLSGKITQSASQPLVRGLVSPSFVKENIIDKEALKSHLLQIIPSGKRKGDIALSLPDELVRISLVDFDEIPEKREEVERLVLWRLKKNIPLPPEMVKMDYVRLDSGKEAVKLLVAVTSSAVIREYEDVVRGIGLRPRIVDIASINTLMMFQQKRMNNAYFVYLSASSVGMAVLLKGELSFFRSKVIDGDTGAAEKEILSTLTYYRIREPDLSIDTLYISMTGMEAGKIMERLRGLFDGQVVQLTLPEYVQWDAAPLSPGEFFPAIGAALRL